MCSMLSICDCGLGVGRWLWLCIPLAEAWWPCNLSSSTKRAESYHPLFPSPSLFDCLDFQAMQPSPRREMLARSAKIPLQCVTSAASVRWFPVFPLHVITSLPLVGHKCLLNLWEDWVFTTKGELVYVNGLSCYIDKVLDLRSSEKKSPQRVGFEILCPWNAPVIFYRRT